MGHSNGSGMSYTLACRAADAIAAIGTAAGSSPESCAPSRPVPVLNLHGTDDPIAPYHGGAALGRTVASAPDRAEAWARRNGCALEPETRALASNVEATRYAPCAGEVILVTLSGEGHAWPKESGGRLGRPARGVDASTLIGEFFSRHAGA